MQCQNKLTKKVSRLERDSNALPSDCVTQVHCCAIELSRSVGAGKPRRADSKN